MSIENPLETSAKEHSNLDEEYRVTQEVLESLDMNMLGDIFAEKLKKAEVAEPYGKLWGKERFVLIGPEDDLNYPPDHAPAVTKIFENKIMLDPLLIYLARVQKHRITFREAVLSIVIHEETHTVANLKTYPENLGIDACFRSLENSVSLLYAQTGNARHERAGLAAQYLFLAFNEAVTDMIAEEVFVEYSRRIGKRSSTYFQGYGLERKMLMALIDGLAQAAEIDKAKVWEAIQRHNLRGDDLRVNEFAECFAEYFGSSFLKELSRIEKLRTQAELDKFLWKYLPHSAKLTEGQLQHWKKWYEEDEKRLAV